MREGITKAFDERHLINILKNTKLHHPNFALLLGAGTSISSGVKSASEMIESWRKQHHEQFAEKEKAIEDHLREFNWYNTECRRGRCLDS